MRIDADKRRDAIGYDVGALRGLDDDERSEIEAVLVPRATRDWRDVEALLALGTPGALLAAHTGLTSDDRWVRLYTAEALAAKGEPEFLEGPVIEGLANAETHNGLPTALRLAANHPSDAIKAALLDGLLDPERDTGQFGEALFKSLGRARDRGFFDSLGEMDSDARAEALRTRFAELGVDDPVAALLEEPARPRVGPVRWLLRLLGWLVCVAAAGAVAWHFHALSTLPDRPFDAVHAPIGLTIGAAAVGVFLLLWFDGKLRRVVLLLLAVAALGLAGLSTRWIDSSRSGVREYWAGHEIARARLPGDLCYRIDGAVFVLRGAGKARFEYKRGYWPTAFGEVELKRYFFSDVPMRARADGWICIDRG